MKTATCYYSRHHGNTLKILQAMASVGEIDLIDVTRTKSAQLAGYDCVGFASGIYGFEFQKAVVEFARQQLPQSKPVFFVYTYGGAKGTGANAVAEIAAEKGCPVLGEFSCKGFDTFGPFKLVGGIAKGHPNDREWAEAIPHDLTVTLGGVTFYMVHNKKDLPADLYGVDVVVFGHSHKYVQEEKDGLLWLNPGSCGPRRFHQEITMMMVEVADGNIRVEKILIPHEVK